MYKSESNLVLSWVGLVGCSGEGPYLDLSGVLAMQYQSRPDQGGRDLCGLLGSSHLAAQEQSDFFISSGPR